MPTLVSDGIRNGKQKGPGTDASMITAMRRNRATLNGLQSEKFADAVSFGVSATTGNATTMTYTYASNMNVAPFNPGDIVTVSGHSPSITVGTGAGTLSVTTVSGTISAVTAVSNGAPQITLTTTAANLAVGMIMKLSANYGGLLASKFYVVNSIVTANTVFTVLESTGATDYTGGTGTTTVTTTGATGGTTTISTTATIATITYGDTTSNAFTVGDLITINGHSVIPNGTYDVLAITQTTVRVQVASAISGTSTSTTATIAPVSSAFNGTFSLLTCTPTTFTIAGPGVLSSTATVTGITKIRTKPIVDGMNSRGYLVSGVLPVLTARGMNLAFFPTQ